MILVIDEGTSSTRVLLVDKQAKIIAIKQKEISTACPQAGWVEQDAHEIFDFTIELCREIIKENIKFKNDIEAIAITNQREASVIWDKNTGKAIAPLISWQCKRTADYCKELKHDSSFTNYVKEKTGLVIDSYFSATKIKWFFDNIIKNQSNDNLLFGTIDTWLIWNLTKGKSHSTDSSNASRTMLFDIYKQSWDEKILSKLEIPKHILPEVLASNSEFGTCSIFKDLLGRALPIKAVLGDQQAAYYAYFNEKQSCAKATYGTGIFVVAPAGKKTKNKNLLTSIGFSTSSGKTEYISEGSIFTGGSLIAWLKNNLGIINSTAEIEELARQVSSSEGLVFIPALSGLAAPHWQEDIKASISGISKMTTKAHIARAALEALALQVKDIFNELENKIEILNVDGGATKNDLLLQIQADLLGLDVARFTESEMTALGVAKMTGLVELELELDMTFKAKNNLDELYQNWTKSIKAIINS